jgi:cytochrome c oxidase subunit 2
LVIFVEIIRNSFYKWQNPEKNFVQTWQKDNLHLTALIHGTLLEIIWTILPAIILMFIAIPSFSLLYSLDEILDATYTYKVVGNQWYWHYETPSDKSYDSYMLTDLKKGDLRLLEVDSPLVCPTNTHLRFIITAADVLHSFAVPSLGIKVDAVLVD